MANLTIELVRAPAIAIAVLLTILALAIYTHSSGRRSKAHVLPNFAAGAAKFRRWTASA